MHKITLICSVHSERGKCTSDALLEIISAISPDVIFEEISSDLFEEFYQKNNNPNLPLEVKCIKKYLESHNTKHLPVDLDVSPDLSTNDINYMFGTFKKYHAYKKLDLEHNSLVAQKGFSFLNSKESLEIFEKKRILERNLMGFDINKNILTNIYRLFHEEQDNREHAMLQNIYNYSLDNQYNQAVFLVGSAHLGSMISKITKYKQKEKLKLNWEFYNIKKP